MDRTLILANSAFRHVSNSLYKTAKSAPDRGLARRDISCDTFCFSSSNIRSLSRKWEKKMMDQSQTAITTNHAMVSIRTVLCDHVHLGQNYAAVMLVPYNVPHIPARIVESLWSWRVLIY